MNINKAVFPPNLRRRSSVEPQAPQEPSPNLRRRPSVEPQAPQPQSLEFTPITHGSTSSSASKWFTAESKSKSQISEELEQRLGVIETKTELIHQKLILQEIALQQLMKRQADVEARHKGVVNCILEVLKEQPTEMLERIAPMLPDIPLEICHTFTKDVEVLASLKSPEPVVQASAAARVKAKDNLPEQRAPLAKVFTRRSKLPAARVQVDNKNPKTRSGQAFL